MDRLIAIGRTKRVFGVAGELKVQIKKEYLEDFANASVVFLKVKGKPIPYFVLGLRFSNALLVKLEEVDTPEKAGELSGKEIFLRAEDISSPASGKEGAGLPFEQLIGFAIKDVERGKIGLIKEVMELPQQFMAIVNYGGKELMVPLNDHFILEVNEREKELIMELPAGLLEL